MYCKKYNYTRTGVITNTSLNDPENNDSSVLINAEKNIEFHGSVKNNQLRDEQTIQRRKKPILSTLDIFFSVFVVAPLVITCWRGLWSIFDIYGDYYPAWEIFFTGVCGHIVLATGQHVFHYLLIDRKKGHKVVSFVLMKIYTYVFLVITVFHWRGGWILLDYYTDVQCTKNGRAIQAGSYYMLVICTAFLGMLISMRCLRNACAPPFAICIDKGDYMFLFPTKFKTEATIIFTNVIKNQLLEHYDEKTKNISELAEKLSSQNLSRTFRKVPPRPFSNNIIGLTPKEFMTTFIYSTTEVPPNYPQLTNYRHNYYPKNLQEIIRYISKNKNTKGEEERIYNYETTQFGASNQEGYNLSNRSTAFGLWDPFYRYKPQEPGDVNLLASANLKFAPPPWVIPRVPNNVYFPQSSNQLVEKTNIVELLTKPFVVSLNIFPMEGRFNQKITGKRVSNDPRDIGFDNGRKMSITLRVFPEVGGVFNDDKVSGSKIGRYKHEV